MFVNGKDFTPTDIADLTLAEQVEFITTWFGILYDDPQNEMPYAEKGDPHNYRYPWGGPYDAQDEISDNFSGLASEEAIEAAIDQINRDGMYEWAPSASHPDRRAAEEEFHEEYQEPASLTLEDIQQRIENGVTPSFGSPQDTADRAALRQEIAELRSLLSMKTPQHGGMGHNNPPEHISLSVEVKVEVSQAIDLMDTELAKETPDVGVIVRAIGALKRVLIGSAILVAGGFLTATGADLHARVADGPVWKKIESVSNVALEWLNGVTMPF